MKPAGDEKSGNGLLTKAPVVLTSFVGRQYELETIGRLLASSRLVTLSGPAGCGKTRLALRVAADVRDEYSGGAAWVELAELTNTQLVPQVVAKALNVSEQPGSPVIDELAEALRDRQVLLVLDNGEHLLGACARLVETLLQAAPGTTMLVTSREPLGVTGETRFPVSPLALPPANILGSDVGRFDAIQLFVERARAILPEFTLTSDNADTVTAVCRALDGIPLAIELAAARLNALTVEQIAAHLEDRFTLLAAAPHLTHNPHPTLRAAIDWSYDLLSEPEQRLLRRLSVFAAGCSLEAARAVCADAELDLPRTLDLMASLVDKSLVVAQTLHRRLARYSLLETIRQYGHEKLTASGEHSDIQDRHLRYFLDLASALAPKLSGQDQPAGLRWLEGEYGNLRAALIWSLESNQIEPGLRLAIGLYQFWTIRDYSEEGLAWFEWLLAKAGETVSAVVQANALAYASFLAGFRGQAAAQARFGRQAGELARRLTDDDKSSLMWALAARAYGARAEGDYQSEFEAYQRVIQLNRELSDEYLLGVTLSTSSFSAMALGRYAEARAMLEESLTLLRRVGNPYRIAMALNFSGDVARCEEDFARAKVVYEESIALLRGVDAVRDVASVLHNLGHACLHLGEVERAQTLFHESLGLQQAQRNRLGQAECLIGFASLAIARGWLTDGARLLAAAEASGRQHVTTAWAATRLEYDRSLAQLRARLAEDKFQRAWDEGQAFPLERAVGYALSLPQGPPSRRTLGGLTPRESEVAGLVAEGKSNDEIAAELVLSKRTVEKHVSNILSKLGLTHRAEVVRWVIEAGLTNSDI